MQAEFGGRVYTAWEWIGHRIPSWLVLPGLAKQWSRMYHVSSLPFAGNDIEEGERLDVKLAPELFLQKQMTVPAAAKSALTQAVDLNLKQTLPGGGEGLVWRFRIEKRDKTSLHLVIYVIKKETLDQIEAAVSAARGIVRTVGVAEHRMTPILDHRARVDIARWRWEVVGMALVCMISIVALMQSFQRNAELKTQVSQLEAYKNELSTQAVALRAQMDSENDDSSGLINDYELFVRDYGRLSLILDLTQAFDDATWVSELVINGRTLILSGFTGHDVTEVLETAQSLPWAEQVRLDGPVVFDSFSRKNRFDLSIRIKDAGSI